MESVIHFSGVKHRQYKHFAWRVCFVMPEDGFVRHWTGSGNCLSAVWCQTATLPNTGTNSNEPINTTFGGIYIDKENNDLNKFQENAFKIVCQMMAYHGAFESIKIWRKHPFKITNCLSNINITRHHWAYYLSLVKYDRSLSFLWDRTFFAGGLSKDN